MAASTKKRTSATGSGKKSGSSSGSKSGSKSRSSTRQPQKRPIRRELWGGIFLLLALCVAVSYFGIQAIFIDWLAKVIKGLFGYGYWLAGPSLLLAALILLFHHGRPVQLRVSCALLLPLVFGSLAHMALVTATYESSAKILPILWKSGNALHSGGAISGALALGSVAVFSRIASIIFFTALFVVLLMAAFHLTLGALLEKRRNWVPYEEESEPEPIKAPAIHVVPQEPLRRADTSRARPQIDIPLDDGELPVEKKKSGIFTGFFRHKSDQQATPDQVLTGGNGTCEEEVRPVQEPEPALAPVRKPVPAIPREKPADPPVQVHEPAQPASSGEAEKTRLSAGEVAAATVAVTEEIEKGLTADGDPYHFPPISLLDENRSSNYAEVGAELRNNSRRLAETLTSFGVDAHPGEVVHGPSVTRYEFTLDQGVKLSKITNLADDIALALGASGVRIAPIPDRISVVGIEVPNKQVTPVLIRDVIESREFVEHSSKVAFALGRDIGGKNVIGNIEKLPHVLIAGTTGSGKSVCTNSLIISLLYKSTPDEVRFIMVDPKMVELAPYNGIPHLLIPVVTDPKKAAGALQWAVFEMMKRYRLFSEHGVKKLEEYNRLARANEELSPLPSVVVVIDELADLMLVAAKEVEESICRVAQMGRAAGMHLVIATQRPSADVITGLMKANIPSRIAFAVASSLESRIILDTTGAEKLVGRGDMLYAPLGAGKPTRVQGCMITPEEIDRVVAYVKESGEAHYDQEVLQKIEESLQEKEKGAGKPSAAPKPADECDELLPAAVDVVLETGQASVSMLQRRLKLGYSRAARLVDQMEERGIVGPFEGSKPRQLLITRERWQELQMRGTDAAAPGAEADPLPDAPGDEL